MANTIRKIICSGHAPIDETGSLWTKDPQVVHKIKSNIIMYVVRKAIADEYYKYAIHLKSLNAENRRLRFTCNVSDNFIDKFVEDVQNNSNKHKLFVIENDELEFIAVGHLALGDNCEPELAFSVLEQYQNKGLGNKILKRMIKYCRSKRYLKGHMICLPSNYKVRHLCTKNNIRVHIEHDDAIGQLILEEPNLVTYIDEFNDSNIELIDFINKRVMMLWTLDL